MFGLFTMEPFASLLLNGEKIIETREYKLPNHLLGERIVLILSKGNVKNEKMHDLICLGEVIFSDCIKYTTKEDWINDIPLHKVGTEYVNFQWDPKIEKYGWQVSSFKKYNQPIRIANNKSSNIHVLVRSLIEYNHQSKL